MISDSSYRAVCRARKRIIEIVNTNPDMDTIVYLTFSPISVKNRFNYDCIYKAIRSWLSCMVSRHGLKYVLVPMFHRDGSIFFAGIINSSAVKLSPAVNYRNGKYIYHCGHQVFNLVNWKFGFSTAFDFETSETFICGCLLPKYKETYEMPFGRYFLSGGKFNKSIL